MGHFPLYCRVSCDCQCGCTELYRRGSQCHDDDKTDDKDDDDDSTQIARKIKELIDESKKDGEDEESEEAKNNLVKRYKEMMDAESDWVRVVEQNIVDTEKYLPPPLPIIAVNAEIDFVVKMDACVSIGLI